MTNSKHNNKEREKEFNELLFASCPTEEKEPFFWRWTKEGKETLLDFIDSILQKERNRICEEYNELILAVGNKYEGETRHETALRYIKEAEKPTNPNSSNTKDK